MKIHSIAVFLFVPTANRIVVAIFLSVAIKKKNIFPIKNSESEWAFCRIFLSKYCVSFQVDNKSLMKKIHHNLIQYFKRLAISFSLFYCILLDLFINQNRNLNLKIIHSLFDHHIGIIKMGKTFSKTEQTNTIHKTGRLITVNVICFNANINENKADNTKNKDRKQKNRLICLSFRFNSIV